MAKYANVREALEDMKAVVEGNGKIKINRFNKKRFNDLMTALANDTEFTTEVARAVNGGSESVVETVAVSKEFRKWLKKQVEKAGVDKAESEKILIADEFVIDDMNPFYDFFTTAMIEYMNAGNYFQFPTRPDFEATLSTKKVPKKTVTKESFTPGKKEERKSLGVFTTVYGDHTELSSSSSCPKFLKKRNPAK